MCFVFREQKAVADVLEHLHRFAHKRTQTKISGHVVRRYRLLPKYSLGDLPKVKVSPMVLCPKATILLAGFSMAGSHVLELPLHRFGCCLMTFSHNGRVGHILERSNVTHRPCRIAMNSVDIAAFIANDAEYLDDVAAIALIAGTAVMLRGRAQQAQPSRSRLLPARAQTKPRPWHEKNTARPSVLLLNRRRHANVHRCRV
jgi:hypothetical protein